MIVLGKPNADPRKTVPVPHCLRAASNTLCQCVRAGLLVANGVCPGHFLGKLHMASGERRGRYPFTNRRHSMPGNQWPPSRDCLTNGSTAARPIPLSQCLSWADGPLAVPEGSGRTLVYSHIEELLVPASTITVGVFVLVQNT